MSERSELGFVLQYIADHGFCKEPTRRLAWQIGRVGLPIHFPGDKVEWQGNPSKSCAKNHAVEDTLDKTLM